MVDMIAQRGGASNGGSDPDELFLKTYGGEVMTAFEEANVFLDKQMVRTITSGKSAQFPVFGKKSARYHVPGTEITGSTGLQGERVIVVDDLLIADSFFANIDEAKSHYDFRAPFTTEDGRALSKTLDQNLAAVGLNAARSSATLTGGNGGTIITNANMGTVANDLVGAIWDASQAFDEKDVPENDRYVFLKPAQYYVAIEHDKTLSKDYNGDGNGSYAKGKIFEIGGQTLVKTNHLPNGTTRTGNGSVNGTAKTEYNGVFTNTIFLSMQKMAIGTVKLLDLAVESEYSVRHQGTLVVSKYSMGHGILRPECAIEGRTASN